MDTGKKLPAKKSQILNQNMKSTDYNRTLLVLLITTQNNSSPEDIVVLVELPAQEPYIVPAQIYLYMIN